MNMVEKGARIICIDQGFDPDAWHVFPNDHKRKMHEWELFKYAARDFIKAMREPAPGMASYALTKVNNINRGEKDVRRIYRFMIDAAVEEK